MPNPIKPKRSYTPNSVPTTGDLQTHELAINWNDGKVFTKDASGSVVSWALGGGGGGGSSTDTALRAFFVPPAPTNVSGTAGNAQVSLAWTAPTVLAQVPITDYVVQYSSNSGSTWTTFSDGTSTSASATVTGLTNGTAYVFRVAAVNGVGTGSYSSASASVTPDSATYTAIPDMTSDTAPSGTVSASTVTNPYPDNPYWYAFDNSLSTYFLHRSFTPDAAHTAAGTRWIQYAFAGGTPSRINGYTMTPHGSASPPVNWRLQGSNDGTTFTTLDTRTSISWSGSAQTFSLSATAVYSIYRWVWDDPASMGNIVGLARIQINA